MQLTLKRSGLLLGLLAGLIVTMALASSSASATGFCGGQSVNNAQSCFGNPRVMSGGNAYGESTGVCVGADTYEGTCAPTHQYAVVNVPTNTHYPWVRGTGSAFTVTYGNTW